MTRTRIGVVLCLFMNRQALVLFLCAVALCLPLFVAATGCASGNTGPTGGVQIPGVIQSPEAVEIATRYLEEVDRSHTTEPPAGETTVPLPPIKVLESEGVLDYPDKELQPDLPPDRLVWTLTMKIDRVNFPVVVILDAKTGEVLPGGRIW